MSSKRSLLIVTNRRLLFVSPVTGDVEIERASINSIKQKPFFSSLVISSAEKKYRFEYIAPRRGRRALARSLREKASRLAVDPPRWTLDTPPKPSVEETTTTIGSSPES